MSDGTNQPTLEPRESVDDDDNDDDDADAIEIEGHHIALFGDVVDYIVG